MRAVGPDTSSPLSVLAVDRRISEVLNYFGTCPRCGYTAQAFSSTTVCADARTGVTEVGHCGLLCGWSGPTTVEKMN